MKYNRLQNLESYIASKKSATNEELCQKFSISLQTLRRDLQELKERNVITKVYGGVVYNASSISGKQSVPSILDRFQLHDEEKEIIGKRAAECVEDNDIIFIDSGTTAYRMVPYLKNKQNITIVTHSLDVMSIAAHYDNLTMISLGGKYNKEVSSFQGDTLLNSFYFNKTFIATVGISVQKGLTNTDYMEGIIKRQMIQNAAKTYVLCDTSKFDAVAFNHFEDISAVHAIITDTKLNDYYLKYFKDKKIEIID